MEMRLKVAKFMETPHRGLLFGLLVKPPPHGSLFFSKHQDDGCKAKPAGKQPLGCHIVPKPVGSRNLLPGGTRHFLVTPGFNLDLCRKRLLESETRDAFVFLSFKLHKEKKQKQTD